jgi:hypothetical protein
MMAPEMLKHTTQSELLVRMMSDEESGVQYCLQPVKCLNR